MVTKAGWFCSAALCFGLVACHGPTEPPIVPPVATLHAVPTVAVPDAGLAQIEPPLSVAPVAVLAGWNSKSVAQASPACVTAPDRFIQYAELDPSGGLRMCLWWNLGTDGFPDSGCWRVDLATGEYAGQSGVWFSMAHPLRVGTGGGAGGSPPGSAGPPSEPSAQWKDDALEVCRGEQCQRFKLAKPSDEDQRVVFDAAARLAVVPLGPAPGKPRAQLFATLDLEKGTQLSRFSVPARHEGAELIGFSGPSVVVTDCDPRGNACAWELYDPRTGARVAAVGGDQPLGAGGTAQQLDAQRFAAVAKSRLVIQDAATGKVTSRLDLGKVPGVAAGFVVFARNQQLVVPGPDGRVVLVDPGQGKITRTILPPRCSR